MPLELPPEFNTAPRMRKPKPDPECANCGRRKSLHSVVRYRGGATLDDRCPKFRRKRSATHASTRREAKAAETRVAKILGWEREPAGVAAQARQGDIDVKGRAGGPWKRGRGQVKHGPWSTALRKAVDQAEAGVVGTGALAVEFLVDKPRKGGENPLGQVGRILAAMDIHDFKKMLDWMVEAEAQIAGLQREG